MYNTTIGHQLINKTSATTLPTTSSVSSIATTTAYNANDTSCAPVELIFYPSYFGYDLAVPDWEAILTAIILSVIIVTTIVGNILVILSVFTYKPLRIVQNFFIVSLAVADLTVAILVLPFNVAYSIIGRWVFGIHLCKMWLTCDVLCCTSSILNLCAIALDRYWAITDPINYAQKRTVGRVLFLIAGVWILSLIISSPPLVGWNDWPDDFTSDSPCELTSNRGYVIYSSLGSFYIPLIIMTIVYLEIYLATRRRLRERANASKINQIQVKNTTITMPQSTAAVAANVAGSGGGLLKNNGSSNQRGMPQHDLDSISSETNHNEITPETQSDSSQKSTYKKKARRPKTKDSIKQERAKKHGLSNNNTEKRDKLLVPHTLEESTTDINPENSSESDKHHRINGEPSESTQRLTHVSTTPPSTATASAPLAPASTKKPSGVYQFIEEKQKISLSKERRAARTLGIIMGVFVICWLPFFLMYVILPFCESCCPTDKFKNFITWLGYINSGLNPVIYTIFNLDYRRAFKRLLGLRY